MALRIALDVDSRSVQDALNRLVHRFQDMTPVFSGIGATMEGRISDRFESERDPRGARWHPWSPATRKTYPPDGNGRFLDRYGDMLDSLNWHADRQSVEVGFGQIYATYHEYGTRRMPRRGLIFDAPLARILSADDEQAILDVLMAMLQDEI